MNGNNDKVLLGSGRRNSINRSRSGELLMMEDVFSDRMFQITRAFDDGDYHMSLELSGNLKQSILEEEPHKGEQLGWAHFYEFKSLLMQRDYQKAYDLMVTPLPKIFAIDEDNAAYMCSAASEAAMQLKLPEQVVRFGMRCLELRLKSQNPVDALRCARQVCIYLEELDRNDLNGYFAQFQVNEGIRWEDAAPFTHGCRWLLLNAEKTHNRDIISFLHAILLKESLLPEKGLDGIPPDFQEVKVRVFESEWCREILQAL
jgi:hypothetical protein